MTNVAGRAVSKDDLVDVISNTIKIGDLNRVMNRASIEASSILMQGVISKAGTIGGVSVSDIATLSGFVGNMITQSTSTSNELSAATLASVQTAVLQYTDTVGDLGMASLTPGKAIIVSSSTMLINVTMLSSLNTLASLDNSKPSTRLVFASTSMNVPLSLSTTPSSLFQTQRRRLASSSSEITSNPLRIKIDCSTITSGISSQIILQNNEFQKYNSTAPLDSSNKTFACAPNQSFKFTCKYPDGTSNEIVVPCNDKRGDVVSKCPMRRNLPSCNVMSSVGSCSLVSYTSTSTTCSCNFCTADHRRLIGSGSPRLVYQIASVTESVFDDFTKTMASAQDLKPASFLETLLMSISFGAVWIIILLFTGVKQGIAIRRSFLDKKDKVEPSELSIVPNDNVTDPNQLATKLRDYLISYVPSLYKNKKSVEISRQIFSDHKLFRVFFKNSDLRNAWKESFHVLTLISANMFILALLFDARYPTDDHSCQKFIDESSCLSRKRFDETYCSWSSNTCQFTEATFSYTTVMILAVLQLLIGAPLKTVINGVFDHLISAATPKYVDKQIRGSQIDSNNAANGVSQRRFSLSLGAAQVGKSLAAINLAGMLKDSKRAAKSLRSTIMIQQDFNDKRKDALESLLSSRNKKSNNYESNIAEPSASDDFHIISASYTQFIAAFTKHRDSLDVTQRIQFDRKWSFLYASKVSVDTDSRSIQYAENIIMNELIAVQHNGERLFKHTKNSPLSVAGAEIIMHFLLDMLGRDTIEAKIFKRTVQKDLRPVLVMPRFLKFFVIFLTVLINVYFVFGSILYGQNKPSGWQVNWITAFVSNTGYF